jgi:hypothetical protein
MRLKFQKNSMRGRCAGDVLKVKFLSRNVKFQHQKDLEFKTETANFALYKNTQRAVKRPPPWRGATT